MNLFTLAGEAPLQIRLMAFFFFFTYHPLSYFLISLLRFSPLWSTSLQTFLMHLYTEREKEREQFF